jgi:hypothetical protein
LFDCYSPSPHLTITITIIHHNHVVGVVVAIFPLLETRQGGLGGQSCYVSGCLWDVKEIGDLATHCIHVAGGVLPRQLNPEALVLMKGMHKNVV